MPEDDRRLGLRARKKLETRKALADAAIRLAVERGYEHVTVDDIAERAGVSTRTFFNYFRAKEDAVLRPDDDPVQETQRIIDVFNAVPDDVSPPEAFAAAMRTVAERIDRESEEWLVRVSIIEQEPALIMKMFSAHKQTERMAVEAIAARCGLDPDVDLYPLLVFGAVGAAFQTSMKRWFSLQGKASVTKLFDEAMTTLVGGLTQSEGEK